MADATPAARWIDARVDTHANGDPCFGNPLVGRAHIIASSAAAEEMSGAQLWAATRRGPTPSASP
ncbi:MAG TPA: hypothetical protein VKA74_15090 [Myxococcota bacterium]|nr:hypothetical protein [Myxococcota bacterium]